MDIVGIAIFAVLAVSIVGAGLAVVLIDRITAAALLMAFTFLCNAGMFVLLGAETIAAFQVLIYVGAITVLILYGVMFTPQGDRPYGALFQKQAPVAAVVVLAIVVPLAGAALMFRDLPAGPPAGGADVQPLIASIFGEYAVPFELASILLLAAMVGAIVLVRRDEGSAK